MSKAVSRLFKITLSTIGCFFATNDISLAQVTPDNTLDTRVNRNGNVSEITGGSTQGNNLFHSFQDFSVPTGDTASFNNAVTIENIFSPVTGGNISNIDGLIRANGDASLFLINPAGIVFGENARLDLGGSFYSSTADSILFEDGEFSASDLENPPLLTINAPIGLNFRDNPGDIVNRANFGLTEQSFEQFGEVESRITNITGLEVDPGQNLALIGGNVTLIRSGITAPGGNVTLGGLSEAGIVAINPNGIFSFPENVAKADLSLEDNALVSIIGNGGGMLNLNVSNLTLKEQSQLRAGIAEGAGDLNTVAGDIVINASESIQLAGSPNLQDPSKSENPTIDLETAILNTVGLPPTRVENFNNEDVGNTAGSSGSIAIDTKALKIDERGIISTRLYGVGNAGDININADTVSSDLGTITSQVGLQGDKGRGNSGDININSNNFTATNFSFVITDNNGIGEGNAGDINITATDSVVIQDDLFTAFISETGEETVGNAGDINITADSLSLENNVQLLTQVRGTGNTGSINLDVADSLVISGDGADIQAQVLSGGEGEAGNIEINANTFELLEESQLLADSRSSGNSGAIVIQADESILVNNSLISTGTIEDTQGSSGEIEIISPQVFLTNNAIISSSAEGRGDTGDISVNAKTISLDNFSLITASSRTENSRESGNINITNADRVTLTNGSIINATTDSEFDGGRININAQILELLSGGVLQTATENNGDAGDIVLNIGDGIFLNGNNASERPETFNFDEPVLNNLEGKTGIFANVSEDTLSSGGNIFIDSGFIVAFPNGNSDIIANARQGQGGTITINAPLLGIEPGSLNSFNNINASSENSDLDGNVVIKSLDRDPIAQPIELQSSVIEIEQTTAQVCQTNKEAAAKNTFTIKGRGGVPAASESPLNSDNILFSNDEASTSLGDRPSQSTIPQPIETSKGKIQPARGIKVTESGEVVLTAYRTNNAGERILERRNCG